jgi:HEAT repeat protein
MSTENTTALIQRLSHSEYTERRKAEDALVALGDVAIEPLIGVVEQQGIVAALRAASALARLGDERGILPVARLLLRDSSPIMNVFEALAQWQSRPIGWETRELVRLAQEYQITQSELVWTELFRRVRQFSPGWVAPSVSASKATTVATPDDIAGLIQTLRSSNHTTREAATAKLIAIGQEAVPDLIESLKSTSPLVRYRAAEALGHIGDARAVAPLLTLRKTLDRDILEVVNKALIVLAKQLNKTPRSEDIPALIALVRHLRFDAASQPAAISATSALAYLARNRPTPALRGALKWLKSLWAPLPPGFKETRIAIEEATKQWKDLPLIADAPPEVAGNLPRPASNESEPNE